MIIFSSLFQDRYPKLTYDRLFRKEYGFNNKLHRDDREHAKSRGLLVNDEVGINNRLILNCLPLLVHLDQRSRWTIAITWRPSSVVCKLFTFQASSPKPLGQLEPNIAGMFPGWSSTKFLFFVPVGYSTWLPGPTICSDWLKFQRSSSLKLMNWLNPNCKWMIIGMSFTNFCFLCRSEIQDGHHRRT
jgi:hypothetical protein